MAELKNAEETRRFQKDQHCAAGTTRKFPSMLEGGSIVGSELREPGDCR